jgi:hypothetical protein
MTSHPSQLPHCQGQNPSPRCWVCNGTGKIDGKACWQCRGLCQYPDAMAARRLEQQYMISYDQQLQQMLAQAQRSGNETAAQQLTQRLYNQIQFDNHITRAYEGRDIRDAQVLAAQADRERQTKRWIEQRQSRVSLKAKALAWLRLLRAKADRLWVSPLVSNLKAVAANTAITHRNHLCALALGIALALAAMLVLALAGCGQGSGLGPKDIELNTTNLIAILIALGLIGLVTVALTRGK